MSTVIPTQPRSRPQASCPSNPVVVVTLLRPTRLLQCVGHFLIRLLKKHAGRTQHQVAGNSDALSVQSSSGGPTPNSIALPSGSHTSKVCITLCSTAKVKALLEIGNMNREWVAQDSNTRRGKNGMHNHTASSFNANPKKCQLLLSTIF